MLGLNAIGIGSRPGFGEHAVPITSPQGAWVQRNRSALLTASSVVIVPDADGGDKEATGVKMANNLANYMQANGVNAGVKTMAELGIDSQFKDFAKFAAKVKYDMDTP
jgi:hypothetical protein